MKFAIVPTEPQAAEGGHLLRAMPQHFCRIDAATEN
jgi:hypothetical protein